MLRIAQALLALAFLFALGLAARSARADTLDQRNDPTHWGGGANHITARATQTVSPTLSCLTRVEVNLMTGNRGRGGDKVTLMVLDWSSLTTPKTLAQVTVDVPEGFDGWLPFRIPNSGVTVPSHWLALQVSDTGKNVFWWKYQTGNPYPGGNYFLAGQGNESYDYLFRTYGDASCAAPATESFALGVSPDPVVLARGGSGQARVSVTRQAGFSGVVNVSFSLPSGVTASPSSLSIPAGSSSAVTTLSASMSASTGSFVATANGTGSGAPAAHRSFHIEVNTASALSLTGVSPAAQQRNQLVTITGSGFDPNCGMNTVNIAGIDVPPQTCAAGSLTARVPGSAAYGPTNVRVKTTVGGQTVSSNAVAFSVGRDAGAFVEITDDVLYKHASKDCAGGSVHLDVSSPQTDSYRAAYRKGSSAIGTGIAFTGDWWYYDGSVKRIWSGLGGAGFSLCTTAVVLDGHGGSLPELILRDLESGHDYQASPFDVPMQVPHLSYPYTEVYPPRLFRSPDGTVLLAVTAGPQVGTGNGMATFFDKVSGGSILKSLPIMASGVYLGNPAISANVTADNRITLQFGSQSLGPVALP